MKTIVTHISPDLDAITAVWLIQKYLPGWEDAAVKFVPAGSTLDNKSPDENPDIIHVDTGMGKFDHHQSDAFTCASQLVFNFIAGDGCVPQKDRVALEKLILLEVEFDHFRDFFFPDPASDRYNIMLHELIEGLKPVIQDDYELVNYASRLLEAALQNFKNKIAAEEEIKKGFIFDSKWGKTLIMTTASAEASKLAMKTGYKLIITKDPKRGYVRIKCPPLKNLDLTELYDKVKKIDSKANWFLHASKKMLINGSSKNPRMVPSSLSASQLIEIVKGV